jgi:hypothetical protein
MFFLLSLHLFDIKFLRSKNSLLIQKTQPFAFSEKEIKNIALN